MGHFRLTENGAITTVEADVAPGPEWESVTPNTVDVTPASTPEVPAPEPEPVMPAASLAVVPDPEPTEEHDEETAQ